MARRRSRSTSAAAPGRVVLSRRPMPTLRVLEDRRVFHPERVFRPALTFSTRPARLRISKTSSRNLRKGLFSSLSHNVGFENAKRVLVCVRRKERREVIMASGGAGSRKPKRRNYWSSVHC